MSTPDVDGFDVQHLPLERLHPNEANPRTISKERFADLCKSMGADPAMMNTRPVVALLDGTIIMGNMRWRAASELGWRTIPAVLVDLDPTRAQQWLLRDNIGFGEWDDQGVAEMLWQLREQEADLSLTGFAEGDVAAFLERYGPGGDDPADRKPTGTMLALSEVAIPDPDHQPAKGDVWLLGKHVLVVADVFAGHALWRGRLGDDDLFVPFPSPSVIHATRIGDKVMVLVQPDVLVAGHLLDEWAAHHPDDVPVRQSA